MKKIFTMICLSLLTVNTFGAANLNEIADEATLLTSIKLGKKEQIFKVRQSSISVSCTQPSKYNFLPMQKLDVFDYRIGLSLNFSISGGDNQEKLENCYEVEKFIDALRNIEAYQETKVMVELKVDLLLNEVIEISADESTIILR